MTTFEQRIQSVPLTPFQSEEFKTQPLELLLKQIYKYQKFKSSVIVKKINRVGFSESTVSRYINEVKHYLTTGKPTSDRFGARFHEILNNLKANHEAILTPKESEKGRTYAPRQRKKPHTTRTVVVPPKYTEIIPDQYGVKIQNTIKLFGNKEACDAYIQCYKEFAGQDVQLVKIEFEVV